MLCKRIDACTDSESLREMKIELIDRFGLLPGPTNHLFDVSELKLVGTKMDIKKFDLGTRGCAVCCFRAARSLELGLSRFYSGNSRANSVRVRSQGNALRAHIT